MSHVVSIQASNWLRSVPAFCSLDGDVPNVDKDVEVGGGVIHRIKLEDNWMVHSE